MEPSFRVIDTQYGRLNVPTNSDDLIGRFLSETGEWAFDEACFIASTLQDGARVLDGGGFLGTFGLGLGLRRRLGHLCVVEANPLVMPLLEANLQRNANVQYAVISALLAGPKGSQRIGHAYPGNLGSASFCEDAVGDDCLPQPEAAVTLKTLREQYGAFDLIKLDIEGMEREAALGDEEYLSRGLTTLWLECNEHTRSLDVFDLVMAWGLEVHYFAFPSHNPDNFHGLLKPILPWAYEAGLLVAPRQPPVLEPKLVAHGCILRRVASREALEEAMWLTPRGLPQELAVADAPTLAAVASRALRGQERSTFLRPGLADNVWKRLEATQESLAVAQDLAVARLDEIEEERRLRAIAEERLAETTSLALDRLATVREERDRATLAETAAEAAAVQLASTNAQLTSINAQLASIQMTLAWRLVDRVNSFVARRPIVHRILRRGRAAAGVLLGRRTEIVAPIAEMKGARVLPQLPIDPEELRLLTPYFDADFYISANEDVAQANADPLVHFMTHGWREGRDPSINFSVNYYLRANPDIDAVGMNPLLHYVLSGRSEGRSPSRLLHSDRNILEAARPISLREQEVMGESGDQQCVDPDDLMRALKAELCQRPGLVVSVSHDDYQTNVGGVQNLVREERIGFEELGCSYLHLSPVATRSSLAPHNLAEEFFFALRLGSNRLGVIRSDHLLQALSILRRVGIPMAVVVHHLLSNSPDVVEKIAALSSIPVIIWVHDYFTICANYNLLRNDVRFCGAPPHDSMACAVCVYGDERQAARPRIEALFRTTLPIVLAPSEAALSLWMANAGLPYRLSATQPLAKIVLEPKPSPHEVQPNHPLRIAYLGARLATKGWLVFERLVLRFTGDSRYEFFHLGAPGPSATTSAVKNVPVRVTSEAPDAMIEAVAKHRIDAVVSWSTWPETFCYAAHEAVAGGAFLLTHPAAGNVPALLDGPAEGQGLILPDEEALHTLLEHDTLGPMLNKGRRRGVLVREGGTAAWLLRSAEWSRFNREMEAARANDAAMEA